MGYNAGDEYCGGPMGSDCWKYANAKKLCEKMEFCQWVVPTEIGEWYRSKLPLDWPTPHPTPKPTRHPTRSPSASPSASPTDHPTPPTSSPTTPKPSSKPTAHPSPEWRPSMLPYFHWPKSQTKPGYKPDEHHAPPRDGKPPDWWKQALNGHHYDEFHPSEAPTSAPQSDSDSDCFFCWRVLLALCRFA